MRPAQRAMALDITAKTLEVKYRDKTIADVLGLTVDAARDFFFRLSSRWFAPWKFCAKWGWATCGSVNRLPNSPG